MKKGYQPSSTIVFFILLVLLVGGGLVVCEITGVTHIFHHTSTAQTFPRTPTQGGPSVNNSKGEPNVTTSPGSTNSSSSTTQPGSAKLPTAAPALDGLTLPSGDFVSNHQPTLSGSPGPHETSVCTTTPGATCIITFTNGTDTKALPARTTDAQGSSYWDWNLQDIGLYAGSWKITATATLNGQTKTAQDSLSLTVSP